MLRHKKRGSNSTLIPYLKTTKWYRLWQRQQYSQWLYWHTMNDHAGSTSIKSLNLRCAPLFAFWHPKYIAIAPKDGVSRTFLSNNLSMISLPFIAKIAKLTVCHSELFPKFAIFVPTVPLFWRGVKQASSVPIFFFFYRGKVDFRVQCTSFLVKKSKTFVFFPVVPTEPLSWKENSTTFEKFSRFRVMCTSILR